MGKGSRPRPYSVTQAEYDARWDAIFGRDKQKDDSIEQPTKENEESSNENTDTK